ncbi:MAG: hypothetical protein QOH97_3079 [Actinoplanes sp.]|jgi:hypothetical protein|nr:hypothetical protein [Actinoplanes sp.]
MTDWTERHTLAHAYGLDRGGHPGMPKVAPS